ncbi:MAG: cation:proton antiporter [Planctomycetes bacterium]|nr:cation:proton antiporter [Planctomycetota bacterium]
MIDAGVLTLAEQAAAPEGAHGNTAVGLVVILVTAASVATLFRRLKLQIIPGYIIAGALVSVLASAIKQKYEIGLGEVENISSFATVLLMFTIGLQLEIDSLRRSMVSIFGLGITATVACAAVLWAAAMAFGLSAPAALAVGMAMSISSTAVLLRVLQERRELHQTHGRLCVGVSIAQDLMSILMLGLLPAIAAWQAAGHAGSENAAPPDFGKAAISVLIGLSGVTLLLMIGRYALPAVLEFVADVGARGSSGKSGVGSKELVLVTSAAIALAAAVSTSLLGFSPELGAFLAGLLLAFTPYRTQLAGQLEPLRDLLMAIFFTTVGLGIHLPEISAYLGPILLGVLVLMVLKVTVTWVCVWALGSSAPLAVITAIYLGNAGEFSLVLLAAAGQTSPAPILSGAPLGAMIAVVVLSFILSPFLFGWAHPLAARMQRFGPPPWSKRLSVLLKADTREAAAPEGNAEPTIQARHVIIAGFGPVGRSLAARLDVQKVPYTVIELNPETVRRQRRLGRSILYGDITNPEVLEAAGARIADAVVITIPDDEATLRAIATARGLSATTFIACRTGYLSGAFRAYEAGADHAVVEEVVTADAMEKQIFEKLQSRRGPELVAQPQAS